MVNKRETIRKRLAAALKTHPARRGAKADLARFCKVSPQAAGKWFKTGEIDLNNIAKVAAFFGQQPNWLIDDYVEHGIAGDLPTPSKNDRVLIDVFYGLGPQSRAALLVFLKLVSTEARNRR